MILQLNRNASTIAFVYHISNCSAGPGAAPLHLSYLFTVDSDGSGLWRVPLVQGQSHSYGTEGTLLVCDPSGYFEVDASHRVSRLDLPKSSESPTHTPAGTHAGSAWCYDSFWCSVVFLHRKSLG